MVIKTENLLLREFTHEDFPALFEIFSDPETMRAPYKGHGDPWTKVCSSEDWTAASLDFLGGRKGITKEFDYRTVCLHILSGILYKATGMKTVDFANQSLFLPLGIHEHEKLLCGDGGRA